MGLRSSSSGNEESDDDGYQNETSMSASKESTPEPISFISLFPPMKCIYGTELQEPDKRDILKYKKYVLIGKKANGTLKHSFTPISVNFKTQSQFNSDSSLDVTPPKISQNSINIYRKYIQTAENGGFSPKPRDMEIYKKYASFK